MRGFGSRVTNPCAVRPDLVIYGRVPRGGGEAAKDQLVELVQVAIGEGEAHPDIQFLVTVVRPIAGDLDPGGQQLHGIAEQGDVGPVLRGPFAVHRQSPLDPRQGAIVLDVGEPAHFGHTRAQFAGRRIEPIGVTGTQLDLDRLGPAGAHFLLAHLDLHTDEVGGPPPDLGHDHLGLASSLPVHELQLHDPDHVLGEVALRDAEGATVDHAQFVHVQDALLDAADQVVLFEYRQVTAGVDLDLGEFGLDIGEEFHATSEHAVGEKCDCDQQQRHQQGRQRPAQQTLQQAPVEAPAGTGGRWRRVRARATAKDSAEPATR